MPDDHHPLMPRRNPEDVDLAAIKTDLEFLIERVERLRREQILRPLYTMVGTAAIVIAWIELFWPTLPLNPATLTTAAYNHRTDVVGAGHVGRRQASSGGSAFIS
jgi:hypothetical protein